MTSTTPPPTEPKAVVTVSLIAARDFDAESSGEGACTTRVG